jgi:hypothetical protein
LAEPAGCLESKGGDQGVQNSQSTTPKGKHQDLAHLHLLPPSLRFVVCPLINTPIFQFGAVDPYWLPCWLTAISPPEPFHAQTR